MSPFARAMKPSTLVPMNTDARIGLFPESVRVVRISSADWLGAPVLDPADGLGSLVLTGDLRSKQYPARDAGREADRAADDQAAETAVLATTAVKIIAIVDLVADPA